MYDNHVFQSDSLQISIPSHYQFSKDMVGQKNELLQHKPQSNADSLGVSSYFLIHFEYNQEYIWLQMKQQEDLGADLTTVIKIFTKAKVYFSRLSL